MWWANTAAVELWNLEELLARDFASDMSQTTSDQINSYLDRFRKGESFREICTFYPKEKPFTVNVALSGINTPSGLLMLNEGDADNSADEIKK